MSTTYKLCSSSIISVQGYSWNYPQLGAAIYCTIPARRSKIKQD